MTKLTVLVVIGTRPEAIKMAPVIEILKNYPKRAKVYVCVTGQHREMLDQMLGLFRISPDFDLNLMQANQSLSGIAARVLDAFDPLIEQLKPDWVLVQGDTTSVMAISIASHHRRVKVGHIEAGLRTFDRSNPFPEELNRVITDHVSDLHFAPTSAARANLLREGISSENIYVTGNTVIDALNVILEEQPNNETLMILEKLSLNRNEASISAGSSGAMKEKFSQLPIILVTAHRRENFGKPIRDICHALRLLASRGDVHLVYPVHRNPNVWEPVHTSLGSIPQITLLPPVGYQTMVYLMKHSSIILTDSGGIQEEAPSLGTPVLVLRETTERPEAINAGVAKIVGTAPGRIIAEVEKLLENPSSNGFFASTRNPFGDGQAAQRIVDVLLYGHCQEFSV